MYVQAPGIQGSSGDPPYMSLFHFPLSIDLLAKPENTHFGYQTILSTR